MVNTGQPLPAGGIVHLPPARSQQLQQKGREMSIVRYEELDQITGELLPERTLLGVVRFAGGYGDGYGGDGYGYGGGDGYGYSGMLHNYGPQTNHCDVSTGATALKSLAIQIPITALNFGSGDPYCPNNYYPEH